MEHIDDYDMLDKDLDGSLKFARECYAAESIAKDERRGWDERISATAEVLWKENKTGIQEKLVRSGNDGDI
ncbi:hypothetical protein D3C71_1277390 [compost metagenome]